MKRAAVVGLGVLVVGLVWCTVAPAQSELSVPAEFVKYLTMPGVDNEILRPACIHFDRNFNEVLLADTGNNRVVIFDASGRYRFEFSGEAAFATPVDIDVDQEGWIYVVGTTRRGRQLFKFDFDGTLIGHVPLKSPDGQLIKVGDLAIGEDGVLNVLDPEHLCVWRFDSGGALLGQFALMPEEEDDELRQQSVFGSIAAVGGKIYVPVSNLGTVYVHDSTGRYLRTIGIYGTLVGQLNFPVVVTLSDDGLVLVLDKHRFNVQCYTQQGRFLGEFGGRGTSPGWFYHPSLLATDGADQVYIGQIFDNRLQICRIPEFVRQRAGRGVEGQGSADDSNPESDTAAALVGDAR